MLPRGCDAVVPVEQVQRNGDDRRDRPQAGAALAERASPRLDCPQGALLLAAGTRLSAPEVAIAAGAGMARLRVSAQPMIVVISTGNELVEPGEVIEPHQVRRSNAYGITAALRQHGFARVADDHVRDDEAQLTERLGFHLRTHDVLILSGGVSMGKLDLVPKVLEKLGVSLVFHHVAQRPGKPMWFGVSQSGPAVFALPGNPVSTLVCLARYVLPALRAAMGQAPARSAAHRAHRARGGEGAAGLLPAGEAEERRLGPHLGGALPHQWIRAISPRWPAPTDSSNCRRGPTRFRKVSWRASIAGERSMDPRENSRPA